MPAYLDIYGLTRYRDADTINRFLDEYIDRAASENRDDEELMLIPLGRTTDAWRYLFEDRHQSELVRDPAYREQYYEPEYEPALTLSHTIARALDYPRRSFSVYLQTKDSRLGGVILSFTVDNQMILGLSMEDTSSNEAAAKGLLDTLMSTYHCHLGIVAVEASPPISETAFHALGARQECVYFREHG